MKQRPTLVQLMTCQHPGLDHFRELILAANEARAPAPEAVTALADAARHLFADGKARDRLESFADQLGMLKPQGKGRQPDKSQRARAKRLGAVGLVIQTERKLIAEGSSERSAGAEALRQVAEREGIKRRTLSSWVATLRAEADTTLKELERDLEHRGRAAIADFCALSGHPLSVSGTD